MNESGKERKMIMLQEALQFKETIVMYYNKQIGLGDSMCNPSFHMADISNYNLIILPLIVNICILN
jgi:hypothetical protein